MKKSISRQPWLLRLLFTLTLFVSVTFFGSITLFAQSQAVNLDLSIFQNYAAPFIEGTASNVNSGWLQRAPKPKMLGFDVEFFVLGMSTVFKDHNNYFNSSANVKLNEKTIDRMLENVDPNYRQIVKDSLSGRIFSVNVWGPTVIGPEEQTIKLLYPGDSITINYNGELKRVALSSVQENSQISGINFPIVPLAAFQITLGTVAGTKFSFRLIPPINLGSRFGKVFYYGGGLQHNPLVWFKPKKPFLDMSVAFFAQRLKVGNVFSSYGIQTGLFFSKTIGSKTFNITPYTGFSYENNWTKIDYQYSYTDSEGNSGELNINVDINSTHNWRYRAGLAFQVFVFSLSFDYSYSKYHSLSGGFGLIF